MCNVLKRRSGDTRGDIRVIQEGDMGWATQEVIRLRTPAVISHSDDTVALVVRIHFEILWHSDDTVVVR